MKVPKTNAQSVMHEKQRVPSKELGKDEFLGILVAQLQNQDPLNGGDNTEYIAQLAQFSSLEQMQNLNENIETGFSMLIHYQNIQYASQLIGKSVSIEDGDENVQGLVEKSKIVNGDVKVVVNGQSYWLEQITEIEEGL